MDWARDYERSLIPPEMRFPQKGDVYEALEDTPVEFMTAWAGPFSGGGKGVLHKGERIVVNFEPEEPRPVGAHAVALEYKTVEARLVPTSDRSASKYGGFYFYFSTVELNRKFRLVRTGFRTRRWFG
jgi:hypothetical protein